MTNVEINERDDSILFQFREWLKKVPKSKQSVVTKKLESVGVYPILDEKDIESKILKVFKEIDIIRQISYRYDYKRDYMWLVIVYEHDDFSSFERLSDISIELDNLLPDTNIEPLIIRVSELYPNHLIKTKTILSR